MARLPSADAGNPEIADLVARTKERRGGKLLNIDRMLLHSPVITEGWQALFGAIRQRTTLSGRARELAIVRVALLTGAQYEFRAHAPLAMKEGVTQAQIDALHAGAVPEGLTDSDRAVLAYAEAMTKSVRVPDAVFAALRPHFDDRGIVELTATIAGYNLVARFLEALQVDPE
jgi:AhpD family alkylhydroperoxidase